MLHSSLIVLVFATSTYAAEPPKPAEKEAIDAATQVGGTAEIDPELQESARVSVSFRAATSAQVAKLARYPAIGAISIIDASQCSSKVWAELTKLPNLQRLVIGRSTAADQSAAVIARMEKLQLLYLGESRITDVGVARLATLPKLRSLDIYDTRTTDRGLEALSKMETLEELNISGTQVTDRGIMKLIEMKQLKLLRINRTRVTPKAITGIEKALPNLTVRY